jgi:hypothetical protein
MCKQGSPCLTEKIDEGEARNNIAKSKLSLEKGLIFISPFF